MDVTRIIDLPSKTYIEEGDYIPIDNQQDGTQKVQFTNLFDSSLSQSDKIAPADTVGQQFTNMATNIAQDIADVEADVNALRGAVGSPLKATTASQMTDTNKIYVYTGSETGYTNGNWYYYDGTAWVSGGVYNSIAIETDKTLTVSDMAADAKVVGDDITDLKSDITHINEVSLIKINDVTLYNANAEFEQGNFTSSGESANDYWVRTPSNKLLENGFTIYNPDGLRWALGVYDRNGTFKYYAILGSEPTSESTVFTDKICKVDYLNDYKYRLRVARTTYVKLSPAQNTLKVYRDYVDKNDVVMKSRYRKPTITLTNALIYHKVGSASGTDGAIYNSDNYRVSDLIRIRKGETIRAYGSGASTVWLMAEFNSSGTFIQGLKVGDRLYHIYEYTADHDMYVKICGQVTYYSTGQNPVITADNLTNDTIIYYESDFYSDEIKSSPLYGKTITGMGDSLMYGSITGNDATWLHLLALKYNMTEHNLGINGNAFTHGAGSGTPMSERYNTVPDSDIIVVEGGANDKNSNVPIGTVTDTENTTFAGALNTVITGIRAMYPKATLLFLTDYNRYSSHYRAYADMMIEVCKYRSVPVFDNVSDANVALTESSMAAWQDEGLALTGTANIHFSPECYRKELFPKYEAKLLSLLGV